MRPTLDTIIGRAFANADRESQADLLNAVGEYSAKTYEKRTDFEMQCCMIADCMNENGWAFVRTLVQFDPRATKKNFSP